MASCTNDIRLRVLLRRANDHYEAVDSKVRELAPRKTDGNISHWLGAHETFVHNEKFRMEMNLHDLKKHIQSHPETNIRSQDEMLQMQFSFLRHILGDVTPYNGPCTEPERLAQLAK